MKGRVLIVEDDEAISTGLALNLRFEGYDPAIARDGATAQKQIASLRPDLVLLDISLPHKNGLEVLAEMREAGDLTPVVVLSARQNEFDKVNALRLGADDYVTKPFALAELLARVAAVLRRSTVAAAAAAAPALAALAAVATTSPPSPTAAPAASPSPTPAPELPQLLRFSDVTVDLATRTVARGGDPIKLTHLEFELLSFFVRNHARVFSRDQLLRQVWGLRHSGSARTVDNFVAQLRAKLEQDPDEPRHLVTVRGSGYRFDGDDR